MGSAIGVADGAGSAPVSWAAGDSTRPSKRRKRASSAGRAVSGHCAVRSRISASADSVRSSGEPGQPVHAVEPVRERCAGEPFERRLAAFGPGGQQLRAEAVHQRRQQLEAGRDALRAVPPHARVEIVGGDPRVLGGALEQALRRLDDQGVVDIGQLGDFVLDGEEIVVVAGVVPGGRVGADGPQPRFPSRDGRPGQIPTARACRTAR